MWNCFQAVEEGLPKTNNSCEGWHRAFNEMIGSYHPTIWKFVAALKNEQAMNEGKIEQVLSGVEFPPAKKKYRDCAERIRRIVAQYENRDLIEYLRGVAHNFAF